MKIVRIIARLNVGGPARHVVWLTKELQSDEFSSVLIAGSVPEGEQSMEYFADEHGVEPLYIREMSRELSLRDAVSIWKVFWALRRVRPDVIHTHTAKAGTVGRLAGLAYKILLDRDVKLVHTYHGHVFHSYYGALKTRVFILIERILAVLATDRIVAITELQKSEINERFRVGREEQFRVIPLGIDLGKFDESAGARARFRSELGVADDETAIGFVGRLTEIKNLGMFLDAAAAVRQRGAGRFRFVLVGDGSLREELEAYAESLGLGGAVNFAGNRDDAPGFYAGLDVVALTSLNEGTPLSMIEAMAAGRSVIATAVGGVPDLFGKVISSHGGFEVRERGLTVASGDAEGLADGIIRLASDGALRESQTTAALTFVRDRYGKDRLVRDIAHLYRELKGANS